MYCDGANTNAIVGIARPGDMGFDVMHFNLHKTFSTPHGGGGPGSGPVAVKDILKPFLPSPGVKRLDYGAYDWDHCRPDSIGRLHGFHGNFAVILRAYIYIRCLGPLGLREVAENAVLNANYIRVGVRDRYPLPYDGPCMHEFVASSADLKKNPGYPYPGRGQALDGLRISSADGLFPAHRPGGSHD